MSLDELSTITCIKCAGTGWASVPPPRCLECLGSGTQNCTTCSSSGLVECEVCDGTGSLECSNCLGSSIINCQECFATGVIGDFTKIRCERCNGSGTNKGIPCTRCSGSGMVMKEPDQCQACNGEGQITCELCHGGKVDCSECNLGKAKCPSCGGSGSLDCVVCAGSGKSGSKLMYKCDLCHGEGKKEIHYEVSSSPELGHLQRMLAMMYSKVEEGQKVSANQIATMSKMMDSRELVSEAQLEKISSKFTNVDDALKEMKSLREKVMETNGPEILSCMLCGYIPSGSTSEAWLSARDYGKSITCDACFAVFKL